MPNPGQSIRFFEKLHINSQKNRFEQKIPGRKNNYR